MTEGQAFRRGDVVLASIPFASDMATGKVRPAVVVQNDVGNLFSPNLIVAAISSQLPSRQYPTNVIVRRNTSESQGTGLDRDSTVQAEVILTVSKANVVRRIGRFSEATMRNVDGCLRVSLGLGP